MAIHSDLLTQKGPYKGINSVPIFLSHELTSIYFWASEVSNQGLKSQLFSASHASNQREQKQTETVLVLSDVINDNETLAVFLCKN